MPITYQWTRNSVNISGATNSTYTLVSADAGTQIDCVVTASNGVGSDASVTVQAPTLISEDVVWDYSWDMTQGDPSTNSDIPALVGGADLVRDLGSYTRGSYPSYFDPSGLSLDPLDDGPITLAVNSRFTATGLTDLTAGVGVHVRYIAKVEGTGSGDDFRFILEAGNLTGQRLQLSSSNLYSPSFVPRILLRAYNTSGAVNGQTFIEVVNNDYVVIDAMITNQGGSEVRKLDLWVNGTHVSAALSTNGVTALDTGTVDLRSARGDVVFVGARQTNVLITDEIHAQAVNAVLSGVLDANRTFDYRWMGEDASSGNAWVDDVGSKSLVWNASNGHVITSETGTDISTAAFSNKNVIRIDADEQNLTTAPWGNTTGDVGLAQASDQSMWVRMITKHISPTINTANHATMLEFRDSAPVSNIRLVRSVLYNNSSGNGGGVTNHWNATVSPVATPILSAPDTRGEWNIHDVFIDGATGQMSYFVNGKTASIASANGAPEEWVSPYVQIGMRANCDVKMVAVAFGANADVFAARLHNRDVALLKANS